MVTTSSLIGLAWLTIWELHVCTGQDPEVNPKLGVPGFPDCIRTSVVADFNGAAKALYCPQRLGRPDAIRIACVGDSITAGAWASKRENTYPSQLQKILDDSHGTGRFTVTNLGAAGSTVQVVPAGNILSYVDTPQYDALTKGSFDIVLLMIGTNDGMETNWPINCSANTLTQCRFADQFRKLIRKIKAHVHRVVVMTPPPIMSSAPVHWGIKTQVVDQFFPYMIPLLADQLGVEKLDMYSFMGGLPTWPAGYPGECLADEQFYAQFSSCRFFCDHRHCDGVHPTDVGYHHMALAAETIVDGTTPILQ